MRLKRYLFYIGQLGLLWILISCFYTFYPFNGLSQVSGNVDFEKFLTKDFKLSNLSNAIPFKCGDHVSLVIVVPCELKAVAQRYAIRNTWGQWLSLKYSLDVSQSIRSVTYRTNQAKLLFVIGSKTARPSDMDKDLKFLKNENHYDDIIFVPELIDSYMNLTLKMLVGFRIARQDCLNAIYFFKADTDVFLNVPLLVNLCKEHYLLSKSKPLIIGNKQIMSRVIRDKTSKWYIPLSVYSSTFFPNYAVGCGYIVNHLAVDQIIDAASRVKRLFFWEDVAITGIYAENAEIIDSHLFRNEDFMRFVDRCHMEMLILVHRITPTRMISIWNELTSKTKNCTIFSYLLNPLRKYKYLIKTMFVS